MIKAAETIPLQPRVVYGPVQSRRFGNSLGINLLPSDEKVCSFNCVYCQYENIKSQDRRGFPDRECLISEMDEEMKQLSGRSLKIDAITIAGNGEPTLHPQFHEIIEHILTLRDRFFPRVGVGILSNSSTCHRPEIRHALMKLDARYMKLDAGNLCGFNAVNRPYSSAVWSDIVYGLCRLKDITLQSMFVTGDVDNTAPKAIDEWIEAVRYVHPLGVQIYSLDRPPREAGILAVSGAKLQMIAEKLQARIGVQATVF